MTSPQDSFATDLDKEVNNLLQLYDFSDKTDVSLLSVSENRVYLIDDPARPDKQVLRLNSGRLAYHTAPSIASELLWMIALADDTDVIVPRVLRAKDASLVQTLSAAQFGRPRHAAIYGFLPGIEPPEDALIAGFRRLGEISARMHLHAKGWAPPPAFRRHTWSPDAILDDAFGWGSWRDGVNIKGAALKLLSRLDGVLRRRLAALPKGKEHFGLIHADLRLANLLVEDERTAIIDFDDCGFGWYLFDLAAALSFLEERPDVPDLTDSWLEGYHTVTSLPAEMEAELSTLIMLRRLQLIGWVGYQHQHLEFARDIGPGFTAESCRLAEDYLGRFD